MRFWDRFRQSRLIHVVQVVFASVLLVLLWRIVDGDAALGLLAEADKRWLLAALVALTAQTVLTTLRWRLTARQLGLALPFGPALREYYLSQMVNQTLPGGMAGDAGRAYRSRQSAGLVVSGQAVIFERLAGQAMLFVVMTLGFAWAALRPDAIDLPGWTVFLAIPAAATVALALALVWGAPVLPGPAGRVLRALRGSVVMAFSGPRVLTRQIGLSLSATICNLLAFAFCARAIGTALSPAEVMVLVPLILYSMVIPLSVSGWGIREGVAATLFPIAGATAAAGLAASTAFGLVFLISTLPGLAGLLVRGRAEITPKFPAQPPPPACRPRISH
ncbi:lysylphosphatidylglycerol synthase transmembrane domain-containing protein [Tropicimonas sp. IMCC34043]|uniref:lysylphosphatidylglycerol synthase transmembrane domain-containing protein n=1 Tax=Tropicimonas sp. IMCC34043 TaxID=2248760 RepID=UPI000E23FCB3|nr:lysylphosphatidylglycerol synthase transmembrane domain-containing protein [Tropicimonas sp. IMCC34043]